MDIMQSCDHDTDIIQKIVFITKCILRRTRINFTLGLNRCYSGLKLNTYIISRMLLILGIRYYDGCYDGYNSYKSV